MASAEGAGGAGGVEERTAAFSAATIDSGLDFGRSEACDVGLLCHERVGVRVGTPALGGGDVTEVLDCLRSNSKGNSFSLVGETESIASAAGGAIRSCSFAERSGIGEDAKLKGSPDCIVLLRFAGGVLAGDDFWGDMDLARSGLKGNLLVGIANQLCFIGRLTVKWNCRDR